MKTIVGIMGPGDGASAAAVETAYRLGRLIAEQGWLLLTGGRGAGVMDSASRGAKEAGGLVIGILPTPDRSDISEHLEIAICTGMGQARNNINVLSSDLIFVCGMNPGTASEVALALRAQKPVILLEQSDAGIRFLKELDFSLIHPVSRPKDAVKLAARLLQQ